MLNLRKRNRQIDDFKWQDQDAICRHMNALTDINYSVYQSPEPGLDFRQVET